MEYTNDNRRTHYGLRVGDLVQEKAFGSLTEGIVTHLCLDKNAAMIKVSNGEEIKIVCEWCKIIKKGEE